MLYRNAGIELEYMNARERKLIDKLVRIAGEISRGEYSRKMTDMTRDKYPAEIARLAEAFGMMMVKLGARELQLSRLIKLLKKDKKELAKENTNLRQGLEERYSRSNIVFESAHMAEVLKLIDQVKDLPLDVLITGESGTGKELVARAVHFTGKRKAKPFVVLNCAALPHSILESELFGIEKGVATGVEKRAGKIGQADGGTLFLDEIGDMSLEIQAKLLRVLQEREFQTIGGAKTIKVDMRVISATNKDLKAQIEKGDFREDLFYRINTITINLLPLRERREDIVPLIKYFTERESAVQGKSLRGFTSGALDGLALYDWPGNVRELENEVKRSIAVSMGEMITLKELSISAKAGRALLSSGKLSDEVRKLEAKMIRETLEKTGGNRSKAAGVLGLSREGLRKKMERYSI